MTTSKDYISIARELISLQKKLQADLPCHINLVDAIGADENANSRILAAILSYHDASGEYKMLKAFVERFFNGTGLAKIIDAPSVVTEQLVKNDKRIDIFISEPGRYAIILENKIMDAPEQPHQLANYIEGLNDFGFKNEQIFVGYLPRTNDTKPGKNAWTNGRQKSYADEFLPRFCNISFRDSILPWLKEVGLPQNDDAILSHSINLYIDYLEGLFGFRPNEHYIDMKTNEFIASRLAFTEDAEGNLQKGMDAVAEIEKLKKVIARLNLEAARAILSRWLQWAMAAHPSLPWEDRSQSSQFPSIGFPVSYFGYPRAFKVFIQIDTLHNSVYYGIYLADAGNMPFAEARDLLKPALEVLDQFSSSSSAKMLFAYVNVSEGYGKFDALVRTIQENFG